MKHANDVTCFVEEFKEDNWDVFAEEVTAQFPVSGLFERSITKTKQKEKETIRERRNARKLKKATGDTTHRNGSGCVCRVK